jgi:hypothetical protein
VWGRVPDDLRELAAMAEALTLPGEEEEDAEPRSFSILAKKA